MIIYKLKKSIPHYRNRYLSINLEKIEQDFIKNDGWYIRNFKDNLLLLLAGPVIFVILLILSFFINLNLDWTSCTQEFLKSALTIPLSFVSIIVPIMTLSISYINDKIPDSFKRIYLGPINPTRVFIVDACYVSIILLLILLSFSKDLSTFNAKILVFIGLTSNIVPILVTALFVKRGMTLVINEIPYDPIIQQMKVEIKEMLNLEINTRLFNQLFNQACNKFGLVFDTHFYPKFNDKKLVSDKIGTLIDVDLNKLKIFADSLKKSDLPKGVRSLTGVIMVSPVRDITKSSTIGYINSEEESLEKKLNNSLIVDKNLKVFGKDLSNFKMLAYRAIENNQEIEFKKILDAYVNGLEYYMSYMKEIGVVFAPSELNEPFNTWRFLTLTWYDLEDIIRDASKSHNNGLIANLSYKLRNLFVMTMQYEDFSVFKMVYLFYPIYLWSFENDNEVGIDRSVRYLHEIIVSAEDLLKNPSKLENTLGFFYYAVQILIKILKESIDNQDFKTFNEILNKVSFLLNGYNPDFVYLFDRKRSLIERLAIAESENGNKNHIKNLKMEIKNIDYITKQGPKKDLNKELLIQKFEAASYLVKKMNNNQFCIEDYKKYFDLLISDFNSYKNLLGTLELIQKRETLELNFKISNIIWELDEYPMNRGLFSTNTMGRILFLFCLIGIQLSEESSDYNPLNSSELIKVNFSKIKNICKNIEGETEKWECLIGIEKSDEKVNKFLKECEKSTN